MANKYDNHEWLSLIDVSGPFLAVPVLEKAFPQGLDALDSRKKKDLRQAYDEWREALDLEDDQLPAIHQAWIELVLKQGLELDEEGEEDTLKPRDRLPDDLSYRQLEYGVTLTPDYAVVDDQNKDTPLMLISVHGPDVDLDSTLKGDGWASTPAERLVQLCRATEIRLGLLTNGECWMMIDAPVGGVTTFASWYARLWSQEPITLQAFVSLLGISHFFDAKEKQLPALLDDSLRHQDEVTDALGKQVQRAVEVLIQALDRADVDRNRELLEGVEPAVLYEAALTVMMRLVFLLSAEERELMDVVKDERFQANYAVSSLRMLLRGESDDIQERRWDAWSRLLAIFRAVYGGIEHETLRMPALGGSLFDPDRFPFLEGRAKGTSWKTDEAKPLPIDNRTVLLLLDAIQLFQGRTLSYRALDVENIGYVYEGLLERTVERAREVTLDLDATKNAKKPWASLDELEVAQGEGKDAVEKLLKERTGSSISRVRNDLKKAADAEETAKLLTACHNDRGLCDRIEPYFHLLRIDSWGYPLVYPKDTFMVTTGTGRRETGTHYTPKSLTEAIVRETLEPVVYLGPAEGTPREEWKLKSPAELLDLKICDPAMGSGAFLVQVCRWLSERLVEAWGIEEREGKFIDAEGKVYEVGEGREPLSLDAEERVVTGRRLIAERCIYGVDINPLAVELAKLSIWLVTLAKGRPFGFLDHNLRSGDSLLGVTDLRQIMHLHIDPERGKKIHRGLFNRYKDIEQVLNAALEKRLALREIPILDITDVQRMKQLDSEAHELLKAPELVADVVVGEALAAESERRLDERMKVRAMEAARHIEGDLTARQMLESEAHRCLNMGKPVYLADRHAFHWPLEFPEVFLREASGFDVVIGNPPFLGNRKITRALGDDYRNLIVSTVADSAKGAVDLVVYFFLRSNQLKSKRGFVGHIATDSVSEGENSTIGLNAIIDGGATIYNATRSIPWPGTASTFISLVFWTVEKWNGDITLDGKLSERINHELKDISDPLRLPKKLRTRVIGSFVGVIINGDGFVISQQEASDLIEKNVNNQEVIFPYVNGDDINSNIKQIPNKHVINFGTMNVNSAKYYIDCFDLVTKNVKPYRDTLTKQIHEKDYWKFWDKRLKSFEKIKGQEKVLVAARASKDVQFTWVSNHQVFSDQVVIIITKSDAVFALLQSSIHREWAWDRCTGMYGSGIRYAPTKAIGTFPLPYNVEILNDVGYLYFQHRSSCESLLNIGLTSLYNRFHDSEDRLDSIQQLRDLHVEMDKAVASAYGWEDIDLQHDFHETKIGSRFVMSEEARTKILRRLLELNLQLCKEEVLQGARSAKKSAKQRATIHEGKRSAQTGQKTGRKWEVPDQMSMFNDHSKLQAHLKKGNQWGAEPSDQILAWLEDHAGWHAKQVILNGCQAEPNSWDDAIKELLEEGFIEREGNGEAARYRAMS